MRSILVVLILSVVGLSRCQLNYEGNPLTENTDYTAEESHFSRRTARQDELVRNTVSHQTERPQKLYPISEKATPLPNATQNPESQHAVPQIVKSSAPNDIRGTVVISAGSPTSPNLQATRNTQQVVNDRIFLSHLHPARQINPAEVALNTFLNSQTPDESRSSLDHYLQTVAKPRASAVVQPQVQNPQISHVQLVQQQIPSSQISHIQLAQQQVQSPPISHIQLPQHQVPRQHSRSSPQVDRQSFLQANQQPMQQLSIAQPIMRQEGSQSVGPIDQRQQYVQSNGQMYDYTGQSAQSFVSSEQNVIGAPLGVTAPQVLQQAPYLSAVPVAIQMRNDVLPMRYRPWRYRGKMSTLAQSRVGPGVYKGPVVPGSLKQKGPIEVIYTRPPGFHRGPPTISNPPVAYEDASAWFPDADHPPSSKDIYYSQLYAQSYDPHYYNYIAKTGKIKPYLYGKFDKHHEEKEDGIWAELFRGFKKHGLKNMMTPTFLLSMTIPAITLMLTALVGRRSFARSDSRDMQEDALTEYIERLQRAMECYDKRRRKSEEGTKMEDCWSAVS